MTALALSEWDDTPWAGTVPAKAATGIGVSMLEGPRVVLGRPRSPQDLMRRAQMAYHRNPWIRLAESTVTRRMVGLPWHLEEQGSDVEIEDDATGPAGDTLRLLEKPGELLPVRQAATRYRRGLTALTVRHLGLCGMAHWYKDQMDPLGWPRGILYVNPARMYPVEDEAGNLLAWMLDPRTFGSKGEPRGGMLLKLSEVVTFYLDPPDWGNLGAGLYEAAMLKAQITNLADQHSAYVLGTGGRIAGIISPKEGSIDPQQMKTLEREMAAVADAPDAAKRTTILSGPIDWHPTAAAPDDLNLTELDKMNRDDILALWGVPPPTAGIPAAAGLNSGGTREYDEAVLMQGSVHDRVVAYKEGVQYGLLDASDRRLDLEIEEPEFDDALPLYEMASRAATLPLRNKERRELVGLAPFGEDGQKDPRDEEVWLPSTMTLVYDDKGEKPEEPEPAPGIGVLPPGGVGFGARPPQPPPQAEPLPPAKASTGLRANMEAKYVPTLVGGVASVLGDVRSGVISKLRSISPETFARHRKDPDYWYNAKRTTERLTGILEPQLLTMSRDVAVQVGESLPRKADPFLESVEERVRREMGERIVGISETTREIISNTILGGFDAGMSPMQLAEELEEGGSFPALSGESVLARAERIARTETMLAYNAAALTSYREYGVAQVEAIDGDTDEQCAARHGKRYTVDEAYSIIDHPNGTLDWVPVV